MSEFAAGNFVNWAFSGWRVLTFTTGFGPMWEGLWHRSRASCRACRCCRLLNWSKRQRALPQKSKINCQGRLTNAARITISAGRLGIRVRTDNEREFSRLGEFRAF